MWLRFEEMAKHGMGAAMRAAANLAVQQAKRHEDRIGRDIACDATSYAANARLVDCCPDRAACRARPRFPKMLRAASGESVEKHRHKTAKENEGDTGEGGDLDNRLRPLTDDDPLCADLPDGPRYFLQHGHIYRCLDASAGARSYDGEFWLGGLLMAAVDVFIGAPLAVRPMPADRAESQAYPALLERVREATGAYPDRATGDRGYSVASVFLHNSELGIASAFPWRKPNGSVNAREDADRDEFDRHGIPRCRHCGGPGDLASAGLGFHITSRSEPVLRFRCMLGLTPDCAKEQQLSCSVEPRMLIPLSRLTDPYNALRRAGKSMERVWGHWRARYGVAGKNVETRTTRRQSEACQELRAEAARLIEWFRILLRQGWLGSHRHRNLRVPQNVSGARRLGNILRARERHGLNIPYGAYAVAAGFAPDRAPPPADQTGPPDDTASNEAEPAENLNQ